MSSQQITMNVAGAVVTLPEATLTKLWLDQVRFGDRIVGHLESATLLVETPRIGEYWDGQGGIYAGVARGRDLGMDYYLLLADPAKESIAWEPALDWAKSLELDGHHDFALPNRSEQALLFANLKDLFEKEWYWSSEQSASDSYYAWGQNFDYGLQLLSHKDSKLRARAVRRLVIE